MSLAESKTEARELAKSALASMTEAEKERFSRLAAERILAMPEYRKADIVLAFLSMGQEIKTSGLIAKALAEGKIVAVPRMERTPESGDYIVFIPLTAEYESWPRDRFGIPTPPPDAPALANEALGNTSVFVLTPGLAFDREGGRLGRGKGYYDRFLADARRAAADRGGAVFACGFCFAAQIMDKVPCGEHDMKVDALVTENGRVF